MHERMDALDTAPKARMFAAPLTSPPTVRAACALAALPGAAVSAARAGELASANSNTVGKNRKKNRKMIPADTPR